MTPSDPIPAATLVLFRDRAGAAPELLVVERAGGMAFAAGALVFPGGRIDPGDRVIAADPARLASGSRLDSEDAAARVAAIRETIEESGLAIAIDPAPDAEQAAGLRAALATGTDFALALERGGWRLDLDALTYFARWCPSFRETRNFDTRFYIAPAPADPHDATVDETENVRLFWASAGAVLEQAARGEAKIIFPTQRNLERLALFASYAEARAHAAVTPIRLIQPWVEERDDGAYLCIPEGLGYPVTAQPMAGLARL